MSQVMTADRFKANMERIYHDWDRALSENDAKALLKLYAQDAVIESPLMPHPMDTNEGVCRGPEENAAVLPGSR